MAANIVCSDTYLAAFSKLDKKTQKKSLETIRLMQRSLRSDSLKVEKLNTKLNFKSARVTQDFRVIFTQSGNTVLLVYIDHHDAAYLWAGKRLQGFDTVNAKPVYEYFEQAKAKDFDIIEETKRKSKLETKASSDVSCKQLQNQYKHQYKDCKGANFSTPAPKNSSRQSIKKLFYASLFFLLGVIIGIFLTGIYL